MGWRRQCQVRFWPSIVVRLRVVSCLLLVRSLISGGVSLPPKLCVAFLGLVQLCFEGIHQLPLGFVVPFGFRLDRVRNLLLRLGCRKFQHLVLLLPFPFVSSIWCGRQTCIASSPSAGRGNLKTRHFFVLARVIDFPDSVYLFWVLCLLSFWLWDVLGFFFCLALSLGGYRAYSCFLDCFRCRW